MKSNLLRTFFEWALITSVLMSVGFFAWFYVQSRAERILDSNLATAEIRNQNNHAVIGMLLKECEQYGRTNADMQKVLDSLKTTVAVSTVPVTKPAAK